MRGGLTAAWRRGLTVVLALATLAGCATVTGTARPASPSSAVSVGVPTVLIIDGSDSMTTHDAPGPRIAAAKAAAHGLIDALPDDAEIGLLTYGTHTGTSGAEHDAGCADVSSLVHVGPLDRGTVGRAVDAIVPSGYTPISGALEAAVAQLPADGSPQAVVLVSDGEDTCGQPPCETATRLHTQHPGLTISTIGFKTDGAELACIANATGGVFVTAANAAQLAARLLATRDTDLARTSLTATGLDDVDLGMARNAIAATHRDFPAVAASGTVTVVWRDCEFVFQDGVLRSINPRDGGRTIDGVARGTAVARAVELYGTPVSTSAVAGGTKVVFVADEGRRNGYEMTIERYDPSATPIAGTVTGIVLCACLPTAAVSTPLPESPPASACAGRVVQHRDITHPALGPMRVFLALPSASDERTGCVAAVTAGGTVLPTIPIDVYGDELGFADPATDSTGNVFITYNPGRYDGVLVLIPNTTGFEDIGWADASGTHYMGRHAYYYAELVGPGPDGRYTIRSSSNDCDPSCAGGTTTTVDLHWNGHDYVPS